MNPKTLLADYAEWTKLGRFPAYAEFARGGLGGGYHWEKVDFRSEIALSRLRPLFIREFGFALLCQEALDALLALGPLVEVGAGSGAWAAAIDNAGGDIIATDAMSTHAEALQHDSWFDVAAQDAGDAAQAHPQRHVLMVWPGYLDGWAHRVARLIEPGRKLIYVGEGDGGCTGDDAFHEFVADEQLWDRDAIAIPQWPGLHDRMFIYTRKEE